MSISIPPLPPLERRVLIGTIVKVRGLRGDLKIVPLTWRPDRFDDLDGVWVARKGEEEQYFTFKRVRLEGGMVYVRFNEAPRRDLAEELVGGELFIDADERDPLPENRFYLDDLVGCEIHCRTFGPLGTLREVMDLPANDVWIVNGGQYGEILIPAIQEVVHKVDTTARRIEVTLMEGLIDEKKLAAQSGEKQDSEDSSS
ncbi:ribosome maturation factor RimM [bacterium]|nr:ribosome maturation factor RimM [bacterium]